MKKFKKHPTSPAWRYLGTDDEYDYYVVNEHDGFDSLTGVFGEEAGEYWSNPIYTTDAAKQASEHPFEYIRKCFNLYKEQGGKYV
jgi:hypothetical protein